jgi:choline dehydrogenase-like flavoprotein
MGEDPRTSFLDRWNRSHEVRNLYVTDGACFSSAAHQNPTLTIMALAARASDQMIREARAGNL